MTPIVSAAACANTRVSFLSCLLVSKLLHVYMLPLACSPFQHCTSGICIEVYFAW